MRSALITGASGGIGLALVDYLLSSGYRDVVCQYRSNGKALQDLFTKHDMDFDKHCHFASNLCEKTCVKLMHDNILKKTGPIRGIINLAGASSNSMSWKMPSEEFMRIIEANLLSTFVVCSEFIPELREQNDGRIINISSVVASTGAVGAAHYSASKAGIEGFTRSLALELANKNVTANSLALGYFDYGLINDVPAQMQDVVKSKTPVQRFGKASELGGMVKFLLSDESAFTTGQTLHVNGGLRL